MGAKYIIQYMYGNKVVHSIDTNNPLVVLKHLFFKIKIPSTTHAWKRIEIRD